ncbi:General odorant-binding protein 83a [Eumeta japonica]|uniref:General odorant-binding protein 83a n=1 Tax=Eumeta variegata TaxID=151549 RepID=A0A4C1WWN1_EUMVA|nr:General odorant-binding protein 83a [Eumeta japonica]
MSSFSDLSPEDVSNCENGIFKDEAKLKCYMSCLLEETAMVDEEGIMDYEFLVSMISEEWKERFSKMIYACRHLDTPEKDICQRAFDVHKCAYRQDPEPPLLFSSSKLELRWPTLSSVTPLTFISPLSLPPDIQEIFYSYSRDVVTNATVTFLELRVIMSGAAKRHSKDEKPEGVGPSAHKEAIWRLPGARRGPSAFARPD